MAATRSAAAAKPHDFTGVLPSLSIVLWSCSQTGCVEIPRLLTHEPGSRPFPTPAWLQTMPLTKLSRYACYYGPDQLDALSAYDLAILQSDHYTRDSIELAPDGRNELRRLSLSR